VGVKIFASVDAKTTALCLIPLNDSQRISKGSKFSLLIANAVDFA
jgi:hypothetical protein